MAASLSWSGCWDLSAQLKSRYMLASAGLGQRVGQKTELTAMRGQLRTLPHRDPHQASLVLSTVLCFAHWGGFTFTNIAPSVTTNHTANLSPHRAMLTNLLKHMCATLRESLIPFQEGDNPDVFSTSESVSDIFWLRWSSDYSYTNRRKHINT